MAAFPLQRVSGPSSEPVTLSDMKQHLRVDFTDDDALIQSLISLARERAEDLTGRCLVSQQWIWCLDRFPHRHYHGVFYNNYQYNSLNKHPRSHLEIILPRGPVISVDSIQYKDTTGTLQPLDLSQYESDLFSQPARLVPAYSVGSWPVALHDINAVQITFTAGYSAIPNSFIHAIKLLVAAWYSNRDEVIQGGGQIASLPTPISAQSLLGSYELFPCGYTHG